jgi:hypothetical protein
MPHFPENEALIENYFFSAFVSASNEKRAAVKSGRETSKVKLQGKTSEVKLQDKSGNGV